MKFFWKMSCQIKTKKRLKEDTLLHINNNMHYNYRLTYSPKSSSHTFLSKYLIDDVADICFSYLATPFDRVVISIEQIHEKFNYHMPNDRDDIIPPLWIRFFCRDIFIN